MSLNPAVKPDLESKRLSERRSKTLTPSDSADDHLNKQHVSKQGSSGGVTDEPSSREAKGSEPNVSDTSSEPESVATSSLEDELDRAESLPWIKEDHPEVEAYTLDEAKALRAFLRHVGIDKFIENVLTKKQIPVRKLVTAFGLRPNLPYSEAWYLRALGLAITREIRRRQKLPQYNTIEDAVTLLKESKNIIVITGAGISTSLGIPDFRSKNTGFYEQLLRKGYESPEDVFNLTNFHADPTVFYHLAREILPVTDRCSPTHAFIRLLQDKDKLLTNYTQNIDNIEAYAGIKPEKLIQCHGSWATATCQRCRVTVPGEAIFADVKARRVARCQKCITDLKEHPPKRKRHSNGRSKSRKSSYEDSEDEGQYDIPEPGVMKPDITFFEEQLPNRFFDRLVEEDRFKVDLVIVIGTSMKVAPVAEIPNFIDSKVPHIYISREPAEHINFDITLLGYCDDVVAELCRRADWKLEHAQIRADAIRKVEAGDREGHWIFSSAGLVPHKESSNGQVTGL